MPIAAGTKFGTYEIESLVGAGGMGEVYRARDTRLQRIVAIKVLPAHLSSNPDQPTRFVQEAKAISALQPAHRRQPGLTPNSSARFCGLRSIGNGRLRPILRNIPGNFSG